MFLSALDLNTYKCFIGQIDAEISFMYFIW